ncbi:hypothetical protein ACJJTC_013620 [Scirpophaga incertulas]
MSFDGRSPLVAQSAALSSDLTCLHLDADDHVRGVTTDGLLSALARLRRAPLPLHSTHAPRSSDGRHQHPKIQSSRLSPDLAAGGEGGMTVAREEASPERLGGALRRLHYKATRRAHSAAARHHASTPPKNADLVSVFHPEIFGHLAESFMSAIRSLTKEKKPSIVNAPERKSPDLREDKTKGEYKDRR